MRETQSSFETLCSWSKEHEKLKHHITSNILLGDKKFAANSKALKEAGVTHVLNCGAGKNANPDLCYLKLKIADKTNVDITEQMGLAYQFIESALIGRGGVVLVHCMGCVSRSPAIVASFLIRHFNLTLEEALALIRIKRPCANPVSWDCFGFFFFLFPYVFRRILDSWSNSCDWRAL